MVKRARRQSDDVYNARRRAKRYVVSLEKRLKNTTSGVEKRALKSYIKNLNRVIQATYRGSGKNIEKNVDVLREQTARGKTGISRSNYIFQQQIGTASRGGKTTLGKYGAEKTKIFYAATIRLWQGAPVQERNKRIMAALGTDSLAEAFDLVLRKNKEALQVARGLMEPIGDTAENIAFAQGIIEDIQSSPEYLDFVNEWR